MNKFSTGAAAPPEFAWQMGKTAATIQLVRTLEEMRPDEVRDFIIDAIKAGRVQAVVLRPEVLDK